MASVKWEKHLQEIQQKQNETLDHFAEFAMEPESFEPFDLEELFSVKSTGHLAEGVWDPAIIWFGTRRTGKSVSLKHIVTEAHMRGLVGRVTVITATKQNENWVNVVPYACVHPIEDALKVVRDVRDKQNKRANIMKKENGKLLYGNESFQHTLILDDVVHDKRFSRYADELSEAFMTFRHIGCAVLITSQYPTAIAPAIRNNADFVFIQQQNGYAAKEIIYKDHLEFLPQRSMAFYFLDQVPKDWRTIVVHKTDPELEAKDKVSWFRATDLDNEFGVVGKGHPNQKRIQIEWGHPEWRKVMKTIDEEIKSKEAREEEEEANFDIYGTAGIKYNFDKAYKEVELIRHNLSQI